MSALQKATAAFQSTYTAGWSVPRSTQRSPFQGSVPITVRHCPWVTTVAARKNGRLIVTFTACSSAFRPFSLLGLPIVKLPAGIGWSRIPTPFASGCPMAAAAGFARRPAGRRGTAAARFASFRTPGVRTDPVRRDTRFAMIDPSSVCRFACICQEP